MPNTELSLDQLQAVSGGATAIEYGLIATLLPKDQVISTECKEAEQADGDEDKMSELGQR